MRKYPYYNPAENILKPWITVRLGYTKTHKLTPAPITALIDSGADVCFCSIEIGSFLGINFKNKPTKTFYTANGSPLITIPEKITLYACGKNYECIFYFADNLPHETPIILGQIGFFDHFKITFNFENKEIEIVYNYEN
ncbi:MAG: retropepsin-like domain-containing protein [Patescibacteria group bacterium]|nr:retropepsin-like domain-containing protein [Patescibacteria group bacterium]